MIRAKNLLLNPYTAVAGLTLQEGSVFLQDVISSKISLFPRRIDKRVIIYGAGDLGKMAKHFFDYLKIHISFVVDKRAEKYKNDASWRGTEIVHPNNVKSIDKERCLLIICVVTTSLIALRDDLISNGWKDVAFFYDVSEAYKDEYPLSNGWFLGALNDEEKNGIQSVFSLLVDDASRAYYAQFIAWHKLRAELLFNDCIINNDNRFFIPEVTSVLREEEFFVDGGACVGSVTKKFLGVVNGKYKAVLAVEPDKNNFKVLENQVKNITGVTVMQRALGDKNGYEFFCQGFGYASRLGKGADLVPVVTLDSLSIRPTFIKMHLEGGELNALKGSMTTIKQCRPLIAVTLYHNPDGAWRLPLFLMNNIDDYTCHFRLHSWAGTGAVLYAIPNERKKCD